MQSNVTMYVGDAALNPNRAFYTGKEAKKLIDANTQNISALTASVNQLIDNANSIPTEENLTYYYTKDEVDDIIGNYEPNLSNYYIKSEVDDMMNNYNPDLSNYYTKDEVDDIIDNYEPNLSDYYVKREVDNLINDYKPDLSNYYTQDQTYTKTEINENYYTKDEVDDIVPDMSNYYTMDNTYSKSEVYNKSQVYNKDEIDDKIDELIIDGADLDLSGYYNKEYIDEHYYDNTQTYTKTEINENYYTKDTTYSKSEINDNYYTKSETFTRSEVYNKNQVYNKNEVDDKLQDLVLDSAGTDFITNYYDKNYIDSHYYTTDNTYTKSEIEDKLNNLEIGSTNVDLSNYYTKSEINNAAYLQSETDPIYSASAAAGITSSDITNWNSKTNNVGTITGITMNGSSKGTSGVIDLGTVITSYTETDPTVPNHVKSITAKNITDWNNKLDSSSLNNYYTKADIDDKEIRNNTLVSREIEEAISPLNTSISNIDSNLTSNYLTKNEIGENFYNKAQINGMLEDIQSAGGTGIELKTQAQYDALENPDSNKIYFIYE